MRFSGMSRTSVAHCISISRQSGGRWRAPTGPAQNRRLDDMMIRDAGSDRCRNEGEEQCRMQNWACRAWPDQVKCQLRKE
jgi:hypothetical protein